MQQRAPVGAWEEAVAEWEHALARKVEQLMGERHARTVLTMSEASAKLVKASA